MTREGEIVVLGEHLDTCRQLGKRLAQVRLRIEATMPMTPEWMRSIDGDDHINVLAFLKTFEQFEDTLGRTLKTIAMIMQFGKIERLTPRDVATRAVALGILDEGKAWADAVRVRNELAHEYPLNPAKQTEQVNKAWEKSATLFDVSEAIAKFVAQEGLLRGDL